MVHKRLSDTIALITRYHHYFCLHSSTAYTSTSRQYFNAFLTNDLASELQKEFMEPGRLLSLMKV